MTALRTVVAFFAGLLLIAGGMTSPASAASGGHHVDARKLTCAQAKKHLRKAEASGKRRAIKAAQRAKRRACAKKSQQNGGMHCTFTSQGQLTCTMTSTSSRRPAAARPLTCAQAKKQLRKAKATGTKRAIKRATVAKMNACAHSDMVCKLVRGDIVCKSAMLWAMGRRA